jgi:hypothetical protein
MPTSKKVQAKADTKARKDVRRMAASTQLALQGKEKPSSRTTSTTPTMDKDREKAGKSLKSAVRAGVKGTGSAGSSKMATTNKRINQSVVARGGKPSKTYTRNIGIK